ncbi:MAG TPA: glycosyltransferase [Solirubrobacteraceae bacterium]|nr:glycosyltransferase [Solirubrobacteraceae bacterium]
MSDPPSAREREYDSIASFFDRFAVEEDRWMEQMGGFRATHATLRGIATSFVPKGQRVLEIGCGRGDLLAALRPSFGVGVDVSEGMIEAAWQRHPDLRFVRAAGEELDLGETFDYVVLCDLVPYVYDLQALFVAVVRHCHPRTRVLVSTYSNAWRPLLSVAARLGLRPRRPVRNWVAPRDLANLAELAGLEVVLERKEVLLPTRSPFLSRVLNGLLAHMPGLRSLDLSHWLVARPAPAAAHAWGVSVIVPCRNEAGSIAEIVERVPEMGRETELVFVENGSTDDTRSRIEEQIATADRDITLVVREAPGKWNAVQAGFAAARHEVLMILDADLTVAPEDLPKFYEALATGRGELINGSRLVYGMETGAMRFLNLFGNKFFAGVMSTVLGQYVKDTLCGTKVLLREDWERMYQLGSHPGPHDPFGDYHLLVGAAQLGLKVLNVPVRYGARTYGTSNMQRFSYGGTLTRLALAGYRRLWVEPVSPSRAPRQTGRSS